jgi:hypothetical protein
MSLSNIHFIPIENRNKFEDQSNNEKKYVLKMFVNCNILKLSFFECNKHKGKQNEKKISFYPLALASLPVCFILLSQLEVI